MNWRKIILPAYGPTVLVAIGSGAIVPLVALSARDLGASIGMAALLVALLGVGQLCGDLPAGALAARIGERKALILACLVDAVALFGAFLSRSLFVLALAIFVSGLAAAVFALARQAYLTSAVPVHMRARALSTLGGTNRIGSFIGPFFGALIVTHFSIGAAYGFAAGMNLLAAVVTFFLPDITATTVSPAAGAAKLQQVVKRSTWSVLAAHRRVFYTMGIGVLFISAARATRTSIVPLWAENQGLDPATTSLIFGIASGVDMLLFYPGGAIMDRFGRVWVAIPSMIVLGAGFMILPLTSGAITIGLVACLMGLGNGISAGIVMTLGADASPSEGRSQFLGGWRLCSDIGNSLGPLLISAITLVAPLAAAAVAMGVITWGSIGWLAKWIPFYTPKPVGREPATESPQGT